MTLQREEIDAMLGTLESDARQRRRANPGDPMLAQDIVARTRALLRVAALDHHLHICDQAQHLLLSLEDDADEPSSAASPAPEIIRMAQLGSGPMQPGPGIAIVHDPFDMDAYTLDDHGCEAGGDRAEAAPEAVTAPAGNERRYAASEAADEELRQGLSSGQLATLDTMAHFGWTLRFVRRPLFQPAVPVAFDRNRQKFVVIEADGSVNDEPGLRIRD